MLKPIFANAPTASKLLTSKVVKNNSKIPKHLCHLAWLKTYLQWSPIFSDFAWNHYCKTYRPLHSKDQAISTTADTLVPKESISLISSQISETEISPLSHQGEITQIPSRWKVLLTFRSDFCYSNLIQKHFFPEGVSPV